MLGDVLQLGPVGCATPACSRRGGLTTDYRTGTPTIREIDDLTDGRNRIGTRKDSGLGATPIVNTYDTAGNLRSDGLFFYQYDAWNRLIQINLATLPVTEPVENLVVGYMVKHFTYDAYGRLIRVQSPWPDPSFESEGSLRSERFYYDGVRRIQEVYIDPISSMQSMMAGEGGTQLQAAAQQANAQSESGLDGSATPATLESEQMSLEGQSQIPTTQTYLSREYVWGPGDWGVDEIVAQYDEDRRVSFPLQDASGDVIALCDLGGPSGAARVVTELVYDAYGQVLDRADLPGVTPADLRLGHKGLFFDRLDGGVADPMTGQDTRRLEAGSTLLGYVRNRSLHTQWGRWLQRDPNATGMVVQEQTPFFGEPLLPTRQSVQLFKHLSDGASILEYVTSRPFKAGDPAGLFVRTVEIAVTTGIGASIDSMTLPALATAYIGIRYWLSFKLHPGIDSSTAVAVNGQHLELLHKIDEQEKDLGPGLYRGGASFTPRPKLDMRLDKDGRAVPGYGISTSLVPSNIPRAYRPIFRIFRKSIPDSLAVVHRPSKNDPYHHQIEPAAPMPAADYVRACESIMRILYTE